MNKNVMIYVLGRFISIMGSMIQWVALPLYILDKTGSPAAMGILFAVVAIPRLIISPFAGAIADRWNRKHVMVVTDFINGVLTLLMYFYLINFDFQLIYLIAIRCLIVANSMIFHTSTQAILPEICTEENRTKVNSINSSLTAFAQVMGPIVGGILYAYFGLGLVIMINVLSFFVTGIFEMFMEYKVEKKNDGKIDLKSIGTDMKIGFGYIKNDKPFFSVILVLTAITFFTQGIGMVVMPYLMRTLLNMQAQNYGLMQATPVLGMMFGSIWLQKKSNKRSKEITYKAFYWSIYFYTVMIIICHPSLLAIFRESMLLKNLVFGVMFVFMGILQAMIMVGFQVMYQERVKKEFFGRVVAIEGMITQSLSPIGLLMASFLVEKYSVFLYLLVGIGMTNIVIIVFTKTFKDLFIDKDDNQGGVKVGVSTS